MRSFLGELLGNKELVLGELRNRAGEKRRFRFYEKTKNKNVLPETKNCHVLVIFM